jgi:hypothetical protein
VRFVDAEWREAASLVSQLIESHDGFKGKLGFSTCFFKVSKLAGKRGKAQEKNGTVGCLVAWLVDVLKSRVKGHQSGDA